MDELISKKALIAEYDRVHIGPPGGARKLIAEVPAVDAVEVEKVAQMLCHAMGDDCPCNYTTADEWLPIMCELQEECPNPKDELGCWKQFIKHFEERKENETD